MNKVQQFGAVLLATAVLAGTVHAQDWPRRYVRIIVPFAAGSSPDILARIINDKLTARIGQPLIVDNRPGAGGNTGTDQASKSPPDGYTFVLSVNAPLVYNTKRSGTFVFGGRLHDADTSTVVRQRDGGLITTDGPFAESKEHLGGFYIINADDLDAALAWARKVVDAIGAPIEVRPFVEMPGG